MKILEKTNSYPSFGIRPCCTQTTVSTAVKAAKENKLGDALKMLSEKFKGIAEVGKFDKIDVLINQPLNNSSVKAAKLVIEPSSNKNDFRTRVFSFVAYSPFDDGVKRSVAQATGNKFAIESVLKNSSTVTALKEFIKESERFFITNYNL